MPTPATTYADAAVAFFTAEAKGILPQRSRIFKDHVAAIRKSGRPLTTAKAIIGHIGRTKPAPVPVPTVEGEATIAQIDPGEPMTFQAALDDPEAFSHGGVTTVEAALIRERQWLDPAERRVLARMRKAVIKHDRKDYERAVAVLRYLLSNSVQSVAWRKAEAEVAEDVVEEAEAVEEAVEDAVEDAVEVE